MDIQGSQEIVLVADEFSSIKGKKKPKLLSISIAMA